MATNTHVSEISLIDRLRGVLLLDRPTYEAIGADPRALPQAFGIVVAASIANGIANTPEGGFGLVGGFLQMAVGFVLMSVAIWLLGIVLTPEADKITLVRILSTLGFAAMPVVFYAVTPIPVLGMILNFAASIWALLTAVTAVSVAVHISTAKALATLIGGAIIAGIGIYVLIVPLFG